MNAADLRKKANIAPNILTRMRKNQDVVLQVLGKICGILDCDFCDIM